MFRPFSNGEVKVCVLWTYPKKWVGKWLNSLGGLVGNGQFVPAAHHHARRRLCRSVPSQGMEWPLYIYHRLTFLRFVPRALPRAFPPHDSAPGRSENPVPESRGRI